MWCICQHKGSTKECHLSVGRGWSAAAIQVPSASYFGTKEGNWPSELLIYACFSSSPCQVAVEPAQPQGLDTPAQGSQAPSVLFSLSTQRNRSADPAWPPTYFGITFWADRLGEKASQFPKVLAWEAVFLQAEHKLFREHFLGKCAAQ